MIKVGKKLCQFSLMIVFISIVLSGTACQSSSRSEHDPSSQDGEQLQRIQQLKRLAEQIVEQSENNANGHILGALDQMSDLLMNLKFVELTSLEGMQALTDLLLEAKRTFRSVKYQPEEGHVVASKVLVAMDALMHSHQPMWLQSEKSIRKQLTSIHSLMMEEKFGQARERFQTLTQHIAMIHTAIQVDRHPSVVVKLDSLLTYLDQEFQQSALRATNIREGVVYLQQTIDEVFQSSTSKSAYVPSMLPQHPRYTALMIMCIIMATLSYAAYRMLTYRQGIVTVKRHGETIPPTISG